MCAGEVKKRLGDFESERPGVSAGAATVPVEQCAAPSSTDSSVSSRSTGDVLPKWVSEIVGRGPLPGASTSSQTGTISGRIKAGVLVVGGFWSSRPHPAADPFNFARHVKQPVLMVNAENDWIFPVVAAQEPLYKSLGTRKEDKEHRTYSGGHGEFAALRGEHLREPRMEIRAWLDRYLGKVDPDGR